MHQTSFAEGFGWDMRETSATVVQKKALAYVAVACGVVVGIVVADRANWQQVGK